MGEFFVVVFNLREQQVHPYNYGVIHGDRYSGYFGKDLPNMAVSGVNDRDEAIRLAMELSTRQREPEARKPCCQKSMKEYLDQCREKADDQIYRYSKNHLGTMPRKGYESEYDEALRDRELAECLVANIERYKFLCRAEGVHQAAVEKLERYIDKISEAIVSDVATGSHRLFGGTKVCKDF